MFRHTDAVIVIEISITINNQNEASGNLRKISWMSYLLKDANVEYFTSIRVMLAKGNSAEYYKGIWKPLK